MRIETLEAYAIKMPRDASRYKGTAGTPGTLLQNASGVESDYSWAAEYKLLYSRHIESFVVKVTTDTGLIGWGEAQVPVGPEVPKSIVERVLAPLVIGEDPLRINVLWHKMYRSLQGRGHRSSFMLDAISAVDIALWDIAGKHFEAPVYQLLGGAFRNPVPVYHSGLAGETVEEKVAHALRVRDEGYRAIKIYLGHGVEEDIEVVRAVRTALGSDIPLMVDTLWMYDVHTAESLGFKLQELGVTLLEAPTVVEDVQGHVHLASQLRLAIAEGETERSRYQFLPLVQQRAVDVIQPDIGRTGLTEGRKILDLAETFNIPATIHMAIGQYIYIAASAHMAAATPNLLMLEMNPIMLEAAKAYCRNPWTLEKGNLSVPDMPGLGVDIDESQLYQIIAS